MRTTISINEGLLDALMKVEGIRNRSEAIRRAVESYVRIRRIEKFKQLAGSRLSDLNWRKLEGEEIRRTLRNERKTRTR